MHFGTWNRDGIDHVIARPSPGNPPFRIIHPKIGEISVGYLRLRQLDQQLIDGIRAGHGDIVTEGIFDLPDEEGYRSIIGCTAIAGFQAEGNPTEYLTVDRVLELTPYQGIATSGILPTAEQPKP